jgi:hypothetical protein
MKFEEREAVIEESTREGEEQHHESEKKYK